MTSPASPPFTWPVRIYYEDTDAGGIVYYANYLKYFERARTEWLRALGFSQQTLLASEGVAFVVRHVEADYTQPARLDDLLEIRTHIEKIGRASLKIVQECHRTGSDPMLLVTGHVTLACIDIHAFKSRPIPDSVLQRLSGGI